MEREHYLAFTVAGVADEDLLAELPARRDEELGEVAERESEASPRGEGDVPRGDEATEDRGAGVPGRPTVARSCRRRCSRSQPAARAVFASQ